MSPSGCFLRQSRNQRRVYFDQRQKIDLKACYGHKAGSSSHLFEEGRVRAPVPDSRDAGKLGDSCLTRPRAGGDVKSNGTATSQTLRH
jgi:hypothetical protein